MPVKVSRGYLEPLAAIIWAVLCFVVMALLVPRRSMSAVEEWSYFGPTLLAAFGVPWWCRTVQRFGLRAAIGDLRENVVGFLMVIIAIACAIWTLAELHNAPIGFGAFIIILLLARISDKLDTL